MKVIVVEKIIDGCKTFLLWIIGLLPDISSLSVGDGVQGFIELAAFGFWLIPMDVFIICFGIVLMVQYWDLIVGGITWILQRLPIVG